MEKSQLENYHVHYGPAQGWSQVDLHELWRYKDLIWLFVKRDFNVMYKQTVLGPAWILINPLLSTAMYCVMFGVIAQLSTDGVPQILFIWPARRCGAFLRPASTRCRVPLQRTPTSSARCIFRGWRCRSPRCCQA